MYHRAVSITESYAGGAWGGGIALGVGPAFQRRRAGRCGRVQPSLQSQLSVLPRAGGNGVGRFYVSGCYRGNRLAAEEVGLEGRAGVGSGGSDALAYCV